MTTILSGDVGGTKCNLGLFLEEGSALHMVFQRRLATRDYAGFEDLISDFLEQVKAASAGVASPIDAAAFGIAGVVVNDCLHSENLPWVLDVSALRRRLKLKDVVLLNDLSATALSLERLSPNDFEVLNQGDPENRTRGVIAAGTGLGEAILYWDRGQYRVAQSEGGQGDFGPRTEREVRLLSYMQKKLPHVSWEEIVSGRGFRSIHEFLNPTRHHSSFDSPEGDAASEITHRALEQSCEVCEETAAMWTEIYGSAAGNFALQSLALGGIYVAGGIAVKILPLLKRGGFFRAFCGRGKLSPLLARIPISVVVNQDAPIWGAAYQALKGGPEAKRAG